MLDALRTPLEEGRYGSPGPTARSSTRRASSSSASSAGSSAVIALPRQATVARLGRRWPDSNIEIVDGATPDRDDTARCVNPRAWRASRSIRPNPPAR